MERARVIEALRNPRPAFRTVRIEGREWRHHERLQRAFLSAVSDHSHLMVAHRADGREVPDEGETAWRLWMAPPDRMRVEFPVGDETVTAVFQGRTWWSWSPSRGGQTNGGRPNTEHGRGPGEILVRPASLLTALDLEVLRDVVLLGRKACRVRARPLADNDMMRSFALHALGTGADEYELIVDEERGFLLRAEARAGEQPFRVVEMTALALDEDLSEDVFTLRLPEGHVFTDL